MQYSSISVMWALSLGYLASETKAYPSGAWPMYVQAPREYNEDEYSGYYNVPKTQYYYDVPAKQIPEVYGRVPYPSYYDAYDASHYGDEDPVRQDERLAALPVGQETWYESDTPAPSWRSNEMDDVNAAFLDNLILTQMAQDAQRRREYARNSQSRHGMEYDDRELEQEDEDVRELKALAGKPLYHVPKTGPHYDEDYPADDTFINWNGNKRSITTTAAPTTTTRKPKEGQDEIMVPRPANAHQNHYHGKPTKDTVYDQITQLLANNGQDQKEAKKSRRLEKRFVAGDMDLVAELRGLKHRIAT